MPKNKLVNYNVNVESERRKVVKDKDGKEVLEGETIDSFSLDKEKGIVTRPSKEKMKVADERTTKEKSSEDKTIDDIG